MTKGKLWKAKQQWEAATDPNTRHRLKQFIITECLILEAKGIDTKEILEGLSDGNTLKLTGQTDSKSVTISKAEYVYLKIHQRQQEEEIQRLKAHSDNFVSGLTMYINKTPALYAKADLVNLIKNFKGKFNKGN